MASSSVRVEEKTIEKLRVISKEENRPIGQIVTDLVEKYERDKYWKEMHEDFARLRADPVAWKEYQEETALWDTLSGDGLENEPPYYSPEELEELRAEERASSGR
jgi:hypothetical protein